MPRAERHRRAGASGHHDRRCDRRGGGESERRGAARPGRRCIVAGLLLTSLGLAQPGAAAGESARAGAARAAARARTPPLRWEERWPRVRPWEYVATVTSGALLAYVHFGTYRTGRPLWRGGVLFDDAVQDALRLRSRPARERADRASDVFWGLTHLVPAVDALVVALVVRRNLDVAWQLLALDAEALSVMAFASRAMHKTARRTRPSFERCREDRNYDRRCGATSGVASFWSGHFAMTAAAAGLTCAHHAQLPLYGGGWRDRLACAATIGTATMTGLLRVMADRHYLSDTLVGGAVGALVGWGIPTWLHYHWKGDPGRRRTHQRARSSPPLLVPLAARDAAGLALVGTF